MNLPNLPNNPFKKRNKVQKLDGALKKLIADAKKVEDILASVDGDTKHTLNMKLCIEDTKIIGDHLLSLLNRKAEEDVDA